MRTPLELRVGSTITRDGQRYVIKEMRFHTPIPPDYATTSDLGGCVTLFIEPDGTEPETPQIPFSDDGAMAVATMTKEQFEEFTRKHSITWKGIGSADDAV